jgi:hypothetical protein
MNRRSRQKSAVPESQASGPEGGVSADQIQELDYTQELKATKEMILREAEYVLAVLSEDKAFWVDVTGENLVCPRCGEQFNPQAVYPSLVSSDGYMLPDEAKMFLRGEGCPYCRPDIFKLNPFE